MNGEFSEGLFQPDGKNHLLSSENFGKTPKAVILVTGYPEGPNELAKSSKATLDAFFEKANEKTSMAQVYTGSLFPGPIRDLPEHLKHALDKAGDSTRIELVVYSAGAMSLIGLPEEYFDRIDSLTFISPLVGQESIREDSSYRHARFLMRPFAGIPNIDSYRKSITPLIKNLQERGRPINVILGEKDGLINNESVQKLFQDKFPDVPITITINPRGHAATVEEVLTPVN